MNKEYTNIFHSETLQNLPNLGFFGLKIHHLATLLTTSFSDAFTVTRYLETIFLLSVTAHNSRQKNNPKLFRFLCIIIQRLAEIFREIRMQLISQIYRQIYMFKRLPRSRGAKPELIHLTTQGPSSATEAYQTFT
jgi:hypothetical protein